MTVTSHLKSFQALELALRSGSFKSAADELAITPAAVGQRIKTLEDYLGIDLIVRGRSGLRPTSALSRALPHLDKAFAELAAAAQEFDFQRVNEIHIAANSDWADMWLAPRLSQFKASHPNILFCVNGAGDVPMRLGKADIEVNFVAPSSDEYCSVLFHDFLIPVSSPENALRIAKIRKHNRLEGFPLLHLDFYRDDPAGIDWPEWLAQHGYRKSALERGIRFQQIGPGLEVVASDAGLMICGLALIVDRIHRNEVIVPFPVKTGAWTTHVFQARFRRDSLLRPQVVRFRTWLEQEARQTAKALAKLAHSTPKGP
jgi:LysR family transcriptional regulator, glycine cleavage system transcriptional activator